jgi:hypothetical protein
MTFLQLKNLAQHALGGNPDALLSKGYIVNEAIRFLYDAHPWSWRRKIAALAATASSPLIPLPTDFEMLEALKFPSASTSQVQMVDATDLLDLIQQNASYSNRLFVALIAGDTTNDYRMQLRAYPVPAASNASYLNAVYLAGFTRFTENDASTTDDTKLPPVPLAFSGALGSLVRAKAISEEIDPANAHWQLAAQQLELLIAKERHAAPPTTHTMQTSQRAAMDAGDVSLVPDGMVSW